jgi:TonB family protein
MARLISAVLFLTICCACLAWGQEAAPVPTELSPDSVPPLLIRKVAPVYPPLARQARIQGTVILKIVINKDGDVRDVQLVNGHPMLAPAAVEAVKQWKYQPYTRDGEVVVASTMVRVEFKLDQPPPMMPVVGGPMTGGVIGQIMSSTPGTRVPEAEMQKLRIHIADPVYPPIAIQARVEGIVALDVRVTATGDMGQIRLVSGHPMLATSAIEAVRQWKYQPYVVNGNAVEVATMVRLNYRLTANDAGGIARELTAAQLRKLNPADGISPQPGLQQRIRVSSGVSQGLLIKKVAPEYPQDARDQHIQGTVILHVIIDKEGNVSDVQLISGHPLLAPAAIEAVRQWKYRPYSLNGEPIEADTSVQVNFVLGEEN